MDMRKWAKHVAKTGGVQKAAATARETTFFDTFCPQYAAFFDQQAKAILACAFCGTQPGKKKFQKCKVCHGVSYCSRDCQKAHWSEHKKSCKPTAEHPTFGDSTKEL